MLVEELFLRFEGEEDAEATVEITEEAIATKLNGINKDQAERFVRLVGAGTYTREELTDKLVTTSETLS